VTAGPTADGIGQVVLMGGTIPARTAVANADLALFLVVGLLAGAHCIGMCGPLVAVYGERVAAAGGGRRDDALSWYEVRQHGLFNLGRAASYALLGGVFGLLGAAAFTSVEAVASVGDSVRGATGILAGAFIVVSGAYYLTGRPGGPGAGASLLGGALRRPFDAIAGRVDRLATSGGIVGLGALHGLLPCPIIYPAYLYAFVLGDPIRGAASLGVLGLGTVPTLFLYATLLQSVTTRTRVGLHRALGAAFLVLGYVPLSHGLMLYGIHLPHPPLPFYQPL